MAGGGRRGCHREEQLLWQGGSQVKDYGIILGEILVSDGWYGLGDTKRSSTVKTGRWGGDGLSRDGIGGRTLRLIIFQFAHQVSLSIYIYTYTYTYLSDPLPILEFASPRVSFLTIVPGCIFYPLTLILPNPLVPGVGLVVTLPLLSLLHLLLFLRFLLLLLLLLLSPTAKSLDLLPHTEEGIS